MSIESAAPPQQTEQQSSNGQNGRSMRFVHGFATDIGLRRQQNQDNGAAESELGLFVVADGMGGHRGGEIASAIAAEVIPEVVRVKRGTQDWNPSVVVEEAIRSASRAIFDRSMRDSQLEGMGTTATALLFDDHQSGLPGWKLHVGHVGDSRCYFFKPNSIWQITRDHSLVEEKVRAGLITREEAKTFHMKNVITRSVGFGQETQVELYEMRVEPGDVFLICSDGLSGPVDDPLIQDVVQRRIFDTQAASLEPEAAQSAVQLAVDDLISYANAKGGHDNITVILIMVI